MLAFLSCSNGSPDKDYEKLIIGKWQLDSIYSENGEKLNLDVFFPYMEFNSRGELTYFGIEDHRKVYNYSIRNSIIYYDSLVTQTDSIITLNNNKMVLLQKINAKNPDGSKFFQADTYYYTRKK